MNSKELIEYIENSENRIIANFEIDNIHDYQNFIILETRLWRRIRKTSYDIIKDEYIPCILPQNLSYHIKRDGDEDLYREWQKFKIMVMCDG